MPPEDWGWLVAPEELRTWILEDSPDLLVVNKPPHVVCHPSRHGPWSSLIGACREWCGADTLHMPHRLDRETSGVMVFAKNRPTGQRLQNAVLKRRVSKTYIAVLCGTLAEAVRVDRPLGRDVKAEFFSRQWVVEEGGQAAQTEFAPLATGGGYTLARVHPITGRRHQIRVHAAWLGHPLAGDKLYGADPSLMLEFMARGFSEKLRAAVPLARHALHASEVAYRTKLGVEAFKAPLAADLIAFGRNVMGINAMQLLQEGR